LILDHLSEHAVDEALANRLERAQRYLGWPLLFLMRLVPGNKQVAALEGLQSPVGQ
jgi:hypothetical protein